MSNFKDIKLRFLAATELYDRLFNFSEYDPKGNFEVVYPGSSVIFNTEEFIKEGILFKHKYADDALAASMFMYKYPGADILMNLGVVGHTKDSVSRGLPRKDNVRDALLEIKEYRDSSKNSKERKFLNKVIDNIFARLEHIGFDKLDKNEFTYK